MILIYLHHLITFTLLHIPQCKFNYIKIEIAKCRGISSKYRFFKLQQKRDHIMIRQINYP